jgi:hypothetical protein
MGNTLALPFIQQSPGFGCPPNKSLSAGNCIASNYCNIEAATSSSPCNPIATVDPNIGYIPVTLSSTSSSFDLANCYEFNQVPIGNISQVQQLSNAIVVILLYNSSTSDLRCLAIDNFGYAIGVPYENCYASGSVFQAATFQLIYDDNSGSTPLFGLQLYGLYGNGNPNGNQGVAIGKYMTHCDTNDMPIPAGSDYSCGLTSFGVDSNGYIEGITFGWNSGGWSQGKPWKFGGWPGPGSQPSQYNNAPNSQYGSNGTPPAWLWPSENSNVTNITFRLAIIQPNAFMQSYFSYLYSIPKKLGCATGKDPDPLQICQYIGLQRDVDSAACTTFINNLLTTLTPQQYSQTPYKTDIIYYCDDGAVDCTPGYETFCQQSGITLASYPECGCFMPSSYMNEYWTSLKALIPAQAQAVLQESPKCNFQPCFTSSIQNSNFGPCPDQINCFQSAIINNDGSINGSITIPQSTSCNQYITSSACTNGESNCNGTCTNIKTDNNNCGSCGTICSSVQSCINGTCTNNATSCTSGKTNCNGACTNINTDNNNCGSCGTICSSVQSCINGTCTSTATQCTNGESNCNGTCTNINTDNNNCGSCGTICSNSQSCINGTCTNSSSTTTSNSSKIKTYLIIGGIILLILIIIIILLI